MLVFLVVKTSRLDQYKELAQGAGVKVQLDEDDPITAGWHKAHQEHAGCLEEVRSCLAGHPDVVVKEIRVAEVGAVLSRDFTRPDLVLVVGGDGTFLTTSHFVGPELPMIGVNSAPSSSTGFFCAGVGLTFPTMFNFFREGKLDSVDVSRMEVLVNGRSASKRVLNDALFCNSHPAETSRLVISCHGLSDVQNSSGVWVGTAAGSTGATRSAGGSVLPIDSRNIQLVVREPIDGHTRHLIVQPTDELVVRSRMDSAAVYIDGPHTEARVKLGDSVSFRQGEMLTVFGLGGKRRA